MTKPYQFSIKNAAFNNLDAFGGATNQIKTHMEVLTRDFESKIESALISRLKEVGAIKEGARHSDIVEVLKARGNTLISGPFADSVYYLDQGTTNEIKLIAIRGFQVIRFGVQYHIDNISSITEHTYGELEELQIRIHKKIDERCSDESHMNTDLVLNRVAQTLRDNINDMADFLYWGH